MIKKVKICGIGNQRNFNYIIVEKSKNFFPWLSYFMRKGFNIYGAGEESYEDRKGNYGTRKKKLEEFIDKHNTFDTKHGRVDIFYGKKKAFITICTKQKNRKMFTELINKTTIWKKPKKTKKSKTAYRRS